MKFLVFFLFFISQANSHQDRLITISPSGELIGFPKKFGQIFLFQKSRKNKSEKNGEISLQINSKIIIFPKCIARLFSLPPGEKIQARASWYHDLTLLPPYLVIDLPQKSYKDFREYDGYEITFSLKDARLMEIEKKSIDSKKKSMSLIDVPAESICNKKELHELEPRNIRPEGSSH